MIGTRSIADKTAVIAPCTSVCVQKTTQAKFVLVFGVDSAKCLGPLGEVVAVCDVGPNR
jgi:hypothetical protein